MASTTTTSVDELPERVLVFTRIKPAQSGGNNGGVVQPPSSNATRADPADNHQQALIVENPTYSTTQTRSFRYDRVLGPDSTQKEVYDAVGAPVLESVLRGCHGTVVAFGQTGAGKTHSLLNLGEDGGDAGLVPRLAVDLFTRIAADWAHVYDVQVAMVQLYNEQADDLLKPINEGRVDRGLKASQRKASEGGGWQGPPSWQRPLFSSQPDEMFVHSPPPKITQSNACKALAGGN